MMVVASMLLLILLVGLEKEANMGGIVDCASG